MIRSASPRCAFSVASAKRWSTAHRRAISCGSRRRRTGRPAIRFAVRGVASDESLAVVAKKGVGESLDPSYDKVFAEKEHVRRMGVVLHPTSLPGPYGCGEVGHEVFRFLDWLHSCGCQCWQVLPLVPPDQMFYSPYTGLDANCGNPLLISTDKLIEEGLLEPHEASEHVPMGHANFHTATQRKEPLLKLAAGRLLSEQKFHYLRDEMWKFRSDNPWVEDSALFEVLRSTPELGSKVWWQWPEPIRFRTPEAMQQAREQHQRAIDEFIAIQFLFNSQWTEVKAYANEKGIKIIGDMPIYVGGHSADVWANQRLFELSDSGDPAFVSGVPPDAFSKTGQLWGTPLYNWTVHREENYEWWAQRLGRAFQLFDETRIDHFRGFAGYYAVEAHSDTAMVGQWKKGPGRELFDALRTKLGSVIDHGIIAEDLGVITPDVLQLREEIEAPGMVVLQFAFGSDAQNIHLPHLHYPNSVVYPGMLPNSARRVVSFVSGTHDNPTAVGWFKENTQPSERAYMLEYIGCNEDDVAWSLIRASMKSVADTCIICLQDIMRLGNEHRMNFPGRAEDNWSWRVSDYNVWDSLNKEAKDLRRMAKVYDRLPKGWDH